MLSAGDTLSGFEILRVQELPEFDASGVLCVHKATGLEVFHVHNKDPENFFSFNFRTVPKNSKGTAHIVEHAVLSGSQHFPVKDPFQEIMKGSAQTFLNAMTFPDKTIYPGASPIEKDYFNLLSMYADAVFFPLLRRETFLQEGIRVSPRDDGSLEYQGIVFNEMKGAYSNHDSIAAEVSIRQLFPDTPMHYDSGGDPRSIKDLTYEEFSGFHAEHYHPSNCKVFFYGSIPTEDQLAFLQKHVLSEFTPIKTDPMFPAPKTWKQPKTVYASSSLDAESGGTPKSSITLNWLTGSVTDPVKVLTYEIITELLLGNPGAPMYQAIIDSEIGEDIAPLSGMEGELRELVFTVGVRGTEPERVKDFEKLVEDTLRELVDQGIPEEKLLSAAKRIEFQKKEIKGGVPQGLRCLIRALHGWMYGSDPIASLQFFPVMDALKDIWKQDPKYFEKIIRKDLLENPHRLTAVVTPKEDHEHMFFKPIRKSLADIQERMSKKELASLMEQQQSLQEFHDRPDDPEDLKKIPALKTQDLPQQIRVIDTQAGFAGSVPLVVHRFHTNDICYADVLLDTSGLDDEELLLLPMFSRLLYTTGMPGRTYGEVSSLLSELTGGFHTFLDAATPLKPEGRIIEVLGIRAKFLSADAEKAFSFIQDMLLTSSLADVRRIKDVLVEWKNDFSISFLSSGNAYASLRSDSCLSPVQFREDMWKGIRQFQFLEGIDPSSSEQLGELGKRFLSIRKKLFTRKRSLFHITCSQDQEKSLSRLLESFADALPLGDDAQIHRIIVPPFRKYEAMMTPSQVAYCACSLPSSVPGSLEQLHQGILMHILSSGYLYEYIRVRGGAYGVGASVNLLEQLVTFMSYRDPHISRTLKQFELSLKSIASHGVDADTLERAVITVVSKEIRPMSPSEKGFLGLRRWLYGIDDETRARRRAQTLETAPQDMQREAQRLAQMFSQSAAAVIAGRELFQAEAADIPDFMENPTVLRI